MSKLFKLKEWLTLEDAATYLSVVLGESVSESDILRLALDEHLIISVNILNSVPALEGVFEGRANVSSDVSPRDSFNVVIMGDAFKIVNNDFKPVSEKVFDIKGVCDLTLFGGDRLNLEYHHQKAIGRPKVPSEVIEPWIVRKNNKLYRPIEGLPENGALVVKTKEITRFLSSLDELPEENEKPLGSKERNTLLVLIAALCKHSEIDYEKRGAASILEQLTESIGAPLTDDTIRKVIKQIEEAVALRSK